MDRRSFLTLLSAASLSVVLPKLWMPPSELLPVAEALRTVCRVSVPAALVFDIIICGKSEQPEVATFDVVHPNGEKLLALAINSYGGVLRWCAAPGEDLPCPLEFVYSGNMTVNVVGRRGDLISFTVIEPGQEAPVIIPLAPKWESHQALTGAGIPDAFKNAWRIS